MSEPDKRALRRAVLARRRALGDRARRSSRICGNLDGWETLRGASCVAGYASVRAEASVDAALRAALARGQRVLLPRVVGDGEMVFVEVLDLDADLVEGAFGIPEPVGPPASWTPEIVLVPGVAFTRGGARLGMGGGFYDRWASRHAGVLRVGVCFEAQVVEALPVEAHDVGVAALVTEGGILELSAAR